VSRGRAHLGLLACLLALAACSSVRHRPAWELPPPPPIDAPVVQPGTLTRAELDNGLHVLILEDRRLPRVVLGLTLRRGEAMVSLEQAGLAPFTAELMEGRGSATRWRWREPSTRSAPRSRWRATGIR